MIGLIGDEEINRVDRINRNYLELIEAKMNCMTVRVTSSQPVNRSVC